MMRNKKSHVWDQARNFSVIRGTQTEEITWPPERLDPGVNFFVLALEELGAKTQFSCEGHPKGFYIAFEAPLELAVEIAQLQKFSVEIWKEGVWTMRNIRSENTHGSQYTECDRDRILRLNTKAWVDYFGSRIAKTLKQIAVSWLVKG